MTEYQRLAEAARTARNTLLRVSGEGGIASQIERGEWDDDLTRQEATDLGDQLEAMTAFVCHTRAFAGVSPDLGHTASALLEPMLAEGLPLNRKERFYTGTVLPMVVAGDGLAHLHRFLALCGLGFEQDADHGSGGNESIEFFTGYNFAESCFTGDDLARFPEPPTGADNPDLVIVGPGWLVVVEAKMFHNPPPRALNEQMRRQRVLVDYWARQLDIPAGRVAHVLLLPSKLPTDGVIDKVVTWEEVLQAYRIVGPEYWTALLWTALDRYDLLVTPAKTFGINADGHMTGAEIVAAHGRGDLAFAYMGRRLGLDGIGLAADMASGKWRTRVYEVRYERLAGKSHWFAIPQFIARTVR
jgi:hypothetical protein